MTEASKIPPNGKKKASLGLQNGMGKKPFSNGKLQGTNLHAYVKMKKLQR